ncbi:MAG: hypothetical protein ABWY54_01955 [Glaciihabitans sp.]
MAKQPAQPATINDNRRERLLAFMVMAMVALSLLAFLGIIIGTAVGAGADNGFSQGIWPTIFILPVIALPIGMILIVVLMVMSARRRAREAHQTRQ